MMRYLVWSAVFLFLFTSVAGAEKIRVGGSGYWSPYCYTVSDEPLVLKGFTVDFLKEVFSRPDDALNLMALPWKRCLAMLGNNELDLVLDGSRKSPRLKDYLFSKEIYHLDNALLYLKSRFPHGPDIKSAAEIDKYSLGGVFGFNYKVYPFDVSKVQKGAKDIETMLKMLEKRRFELAIGFEQIVRSRMRLKGISDTDIACIPMPGVESLHFYIFGNHTPKTRRLIQRIDSALGEMAADGRLERLKRKYGLQGDWK
ncbi:ABC transporter substrate-binding protein [Desulfovibrio sp. JC010]|uniref:substrate-binding periplasmic protein n=1 Tax=Desulfovibrio sp. JC010 TaxID=2593641 RepID=UPI0013CFC3E2|nr:transporter substrate-binding domain-containing protein [Desulfovibrio sp. JC010]NDV28745.1 amino acid ABC transporter substrate-binding protein [Desulfovibrio sp. JC010]